MAYLEFIGGGEGTRSCGGRRGCARQPCGNATPKELLLLACRGQLLVLDEDVRLMTADTGLVLHEWIGLQLRHLIAVAGVACGQAGLAGKVLCRCLAMADGALDAAGAMRAGFPLVIDGLMAVDAGFPGWKEPVVNQRGLILLSEGRLDGSRRKQKREQG